MFALPLAGRSVALDDVPVETTLFLVTVTSLVLATAAQSGLLTTLALVGALATLPFVVYDALRWSVGDRSDERVTATAAESVGDDPIHELRERYARGEVGEATLERELERLLSRGDADRIDGRERRGEPPSGGSDDATAVIESDEGRGSEAAFES